MITKIKDHELAALTNDLRDIAQEFHSHRCLREMIKNRLIVSISPPKTCFSCDNCTSCSVTPEINTVYQDLLSLSSKLEKSKQAKR